MTELFELDLVSAANGIATLEFSSVELVTSLFNRIQDCEPFISAFAATWYDEAIDQAGRADREIRADGPRSPLHGVPVALKDLYDVAGKRTGCGSEARNDHIATTDSWMTERLRSLGAVLVGKTQTHEFAFGVMTPRSTNPWSLRHSPGGSSGGSGAAVAAGEIPLAFGTDTGGSIRGPATHCGVVGLKPTFGVLQTKGVVPCSWSLDHAGPLARRVRDVRLAFETVSDRQVLTARREPYRLGVPTNYFFDRVDSFVADSVLAALSRIDRSTVQLIDIEVPDAELYLSVLFGIAVPEVGAVHASVLATSRHLYGDDVLPVIEAGIRFPARLYIDSLRARERIRSNWLALLRREHLDAVVTPTHPTAAPLLGATHISWPDGVTEPVNEAFSRLTCPANLIGFPALSVPCGSDATGLPVGLQIIGAPHAEHVIMDIAEYVEETSGRAELLPIHPNRRVD